MANRYGYNFRGMPTPWGEAQHQEKVVPGVYTVDTAGHGGYLVGKRIAKKVLSERAQAIGMEWGRWLAFEEDCNWAAVVYEHPDWGYGVNLEQNKRRAKECLERWHPEYFTVSEVA